jgi:hypothetical protein
MPRPKIPVDDRLEIMELFAYYAWALNTGDVEAIMECFAPDGSMEHQPQGIFYGQDIRKLWDHLWYAKPGWFIGRQHLANQLGQRLHQGQRRVAVQVHEDLQVDG